MSQNDPTYQEGTEQIGIITLIGIIVGLMLVGVMMFSLTWALC